MSWKQVRDAVNSTDLEHLKKLGKNVVKYKSKRWGTTALHFAVQKNKLKVFRFLVSNFPELLELHDDYGHNVFDYMNKDTCHKFMSIIMTTCSTLLVQKSPILGTSALHRAVKRNCLVVVKEMLRLQPTAICDVSRFCESLLHLAVGGKKQMKMVRFLLSLAPQQLLAFKSQSNESALFVATKKNDLAMVQLLHEANPSMVDSKETQFEWTSFTFAVAANHSEIVDFFLTARPIVIHQTQNFDDNVLFLSRSLPMVQKLLKFEPALIDGMNRFRQTPLHRAVLMRDECLARFFFTTKPDLIYAKNVHGESPLQLAFDSCQFEMVAMFLKLNANIRDRDKLGNNTLHMAITCCTQDVVRKVLQCHPELTMCANHYKNTPFELTLQLCKFDMTKLLLPHATMDYLVQFKRYEFLNIWVEQLLEQQFRFFKKLLLPELTNIILQYFA